MPLHIKALETKKGVSFRLWRSTGGLLNVPSGDEITITEEELEQLVDEAQPYLGQG